MDDIVQDKNLARKPEANARVTKKSELPKESRDEAFAISQCLDYLEDASKSAGLLMTAHLIGLAAEVACQAAANGREYVNSKGDTNN